MMQKRIRFFGKISTGFGQYGKKRSSGLMPIRFGFKDWAAGSSKEREMKGFVNCSRINARFFEWLTCVCRRIGYF